MHALGVQIDSCTVQAYVTGLEAANHVIHHSGQGKTAHIIPLEPEEGHVLATRQVLRAGQALQRLNPLAGLLPTVLQ